MKSPLHREETSVPRHSIASLGPSLFRPTTEPAPQPIAAPAPAPTLQRGPASLARATRLTVVGLGIAGVLPPLAFTARPGELGEIGAIPVSIALTALLILAPALVGLVVAMFGLEGVRDSFRLRGDKEHEQSVLRIFLAALAVVYGFGAAAYGGNAASCQIVAALALVGAWVFLLLTILDPISSPLRHYAGMGFDAAMLAGFLHYGAGLTAPWFPILLLATFYAGFRFGSTAITASITNVLGFAVVVATTPFWQQQMLLAGGLLVAMIVLPAYVGSMAREVAQSREAAAAAQAARTRFMMVISQALRAPLDAMIGGVGERGGREPETPAGVPSARALLSQVNNILNFSAIESGAFTPTIEAFDLHTVVNETLADRRSEAEARSLKLRVHIAPTLPYRLRGWPQQLAQILDYLVARAIEVTGEGAVRIAIDGAGAGGNKVNLRLTVRDNGAPLTPADAEVMFDPFASAADRERPAPSAHGVFGLAVVRRLVELMGGQITIDTNAAKGGSFTITVPLVVDQPAFDHQLDLERCLMLIATEDSQFASDLAEPLNAWNGDPRWIEGFGGTLGFAERRDSGSSVLIVDGRTHVLAALSFAHRAVTGPSAPSFVLVVAEATQIDGLIELADGELDGVLAAPLDNQLLANTLHALPLWHGTAPKPVMMPTTVEPPPVIVEAPGHVLDPPIPPAIEPVPQVTPISMHPRFAADAPIVDARAIAALRGLGDGDDFFAEVIDSFRTETKEIMNRVVRAAAAGDAAAFARGLHALRSCAGNLGGTRLCELLLAMRDVSQRELREQGSGVVQRLGDELARLDAALVEFLPDRGSSRRGA
jgi:two-component system sensor histidine kinase RpfC